MINLHNLIQRHNHLKIYLNYLINWQIHLTTDLFNLIQQEIFGLPTVVSPRLYIWDIRYSKISLSRSKEKNWTEEVEEVASDDKNAGFSRVFARICVKEPLLENNKVLLYWRAFMNKQPMDWEQIQTSPGHPCQKIPHTTTYVNMCWASSSLKVPTFSLILEDVTNQTLFRC